MEYIEIGDLYNQHARQLKSYIYSRVGSEQDAEDILHDAFIRLSKAAKKIKIEDSKKYLFTIARNIIIDGSRRPKVILTDMAWDDYISEWASEENGPAESISLEKDIKIVEAAILSLSKRCQQAFVMRVFHGYSHNEIAGHMNISIKTVEKHLTKGFAVCREYMRKAEKNKMVSMKCNVTKLKFS